MIKLLKDLSSAALVRDEIFNTQRSVTQETKVNAPRILSRNIKANIAGISGFAVAGGVDIAMGIESINNRNIPGMVVTGLGLVGSLATGFLQTRLLNANTQASIALIQR